MATKNTMNNLTIFTCNWLVAERALRALESCRQFYPDANYVVIDDASDESQKDEFFRVYNAEHYRRDLVYDPDISKLKKDWITFYRNPKHIHHGTAMSYGVQKIKTKWALHIDSDARMIKAGVIEKMFEMVNQSPEPDKICGVGEDKTRDNEYPNLAKQILLIRPDLYRQWNLSFVEKDRIEGGAYYFKPLLDQGYQMIKTNLKEYYHHLRWSEETKNLWERYY